jgi:hypothetical protein
MACADPVLVRRKLWQNWWKPASNFHFLRKSILNPLPVTEQNFFQSLGNKGDPGIVLHTAAYVALETSFKREDPPMTISPRIALGVSAAALSLSLALAPAAFAQDAMKKDDGMKKDTMSK